MKKFKKADTFGLKDDWQIDSDQLKEVYKETQNNEFPQHEEDIEIMIIALEKLGYIDFEDKKEVMERPAGFGEKITQAQANEFNKKYPGPILGGRVLDKKELRK